MQSAIFYRVSNTVTQQGLWYDFKGVFTGLIHMKFNFCTNTNLPMPFNEDVVGWLSAADSREQLDKWFTREDILELQKHGFTISVYEATRYRLAEGHWLIDQESSKVIELITLV